MPNAEAIVETVLPIVWPITSDVVIMPMRFALNLSLMYPSTRVPENVFGAQALTM